MAYEGNVVESAVVSLPRYPVTFIVYRSTFDGRMYIAYFKGVATIFKDDLIRLEIIQPRPTPIKESDAWKDVREYLKEMYDVNIDVVEEPVSVSGILNFFIRVKNMLAVRAHAVENITRGVRYS